MSAPMKPDDPAYWMLQQGLKDPSKRTITNVYDPDCYICRDPEFAMMGLPLCYPCDKCDGHTPADHSVCSVCGHDNQPEPGPDDEAPVDDLNLS